MWLYLFIGSVVLQDRGISYFIGSVVLQDRRISYNVHNWQRAPKPSIIFPTPSFFQILQTHSPPITLSPAFFVALFLWLNGWSHHIWFVVLLNDFMQLCLSSLDTVVPEGLTVCFMQQGITFTKIGEKMQIFTSTLILYLSHIYRQRHTAHTGTNRLTYSYKNIYPPPVMCSQQLSVLHWRIIRWYQKCTLKSPTMTLLFKTYSFVEVTYMLIKFNSITFFPWNTKDADWNGKNKQNTHTCTHQTLRAPRKITERVS